MNLRQLGSMAALLLAGCNTSSPSDPAEPSDLAAANGPLHVLHAKSCSAMAFSHDGNFLALTHERTLALWDLTLGKPVAEAHWPARSGGCRFIVFAPDGTSVATIHEAPDLAMPAELRVWRFGEAGQLEASGTLPVEKSAARSRTPLHAALAGGRWLVPGEGPETESQGATGRIGGWRGVSCVASGQQLLTFDFDGGVHRWDAATMCRLDPKPPGARAYFIAVYAAVLAPVAKRAALADDYTVCLVDLATGRQIERLAFPHGIKGVAISPDARLLTVADKRRGQWLIDGRTGARYGWWDPTGPVAFSPDGRLVACREENAVVVRNVTDVVANAKEAPPELLSDPPNPTLQLELISRCAEYTLEPGDPPVESLGPVVGSSKVDMELLVRNVSPMNVVLNPRAHWEMFLVGDGAVNGRWEYQVGEPPDEPDPPLIRLAPGQVYRIPVKQLSDDPGQHSRWLLPGAYSVYASYLRGKDTIRARPIQVKVVAP